MDNCNQTQRTRMNISPSHPKDRDIPNGPRRVPVTRASLSSSWSAPATAAPWTPAQGTRRPLPSVSQPIYIGKRWVCPNSFLAVPHPHQIFTPRLPALGTSPMERNPQHFCQLDLPLLHRPQRRGTSRMPSKKPRCFPGCGSVCVWSVLPVLR